MPQNPDITRFTFDGQTLRTLTIDGDTLFCGEDVCAILGYDFPNSTISMQCRDALERYPIETEGETQKYVFITESDLRRLIIYSNTPTAWKFKRWIFEEALPQLRTHHIDLTPEAARRFLQDPQALQYALQILQQERAINRTLERTIEEDTDKEDRAYGRGYEEGYRRALHVAHTDINQYFVTNKSRYDHNA